MDTMTITKRIETLQTNHIDRSPDNASPSSKPLLLKLVQFAFQTLGPIFPAFAAKIAIRLFSTPQKRAYHKVSDEILESARMFEFLYGKQILKGYEWGRGAQTILLVHGWESRGTALRTFVPGLVAQGYRVVAFDGPAHGNSGGKRTNLVHFSGAVQAAIRQIGKVHGIIAHSFGGASTVYALANAKKPVEIEKLVLIAVPNSIQRVLEQTIRTLKLPKSVAEEFFKIIENILQAPVHSADVSQAYEHVQIKEALLVHDRQDRIVPFTTSEKIYESWDNATLLVTEGLGHYRLMKNPDLIERVVDFVKD